MTTNEPPRHEHDCDRCTYMGRWRNFDLYFCPQGGIPTVIARFGTDGDYYSGLPFEESVPAIAVAAERARIAGWLT